MGKAEGRGENWHGHVTAVTVRRRALDGCAAKPFASHACARPQVAPEYRRQGLAQKLMGILEEITIKRRVPRLRVRVAAPTERCWPVNGACCALTQLRRLPRAGTTATSWTCLCASQTRWRSGCMRRCAAQAQAYSAARLTRLRRQFGYSVYRQVIGYYSGEEDAYGAHQRGCGVCGAGSRPGRSQTCARRCRATCTKSQSYRSSGQSSRPSWTTTDARGVKRGKPSEASVRSLPAKRGAAETRDRHSALIRHTPKGIPLDTTCAVVRRTRTKERVRWCDARARRSRRLLPLLGADLGQVHDALGVAPAEGRMDSA